MSEAREIIEEEREPAARWLENGIVFQNGITYAEWRDEWRKAETMEDGISWWVGDILVYGEDNFEDWSQVIDPKYTEKYRGKTRVSRTYPPGPERRKGFSWSFHRELCALDKADRDMWFARAEREGWSTIDRLKEERAKAKSQSYPSNGGPPDEPPPPMSEDDYFNGTPAAPARDAAAAPRERAPASDVDEIRGLIEDVREYVGQTDMWAMLAGRMSEVIDRPDIPPAVFEDDTDALGLIPAEWLLTLIERDDGTWECRLRKTGQRQAIGLSPDRRSAVIEAVLAARLSDLGV